MPTYVHRLGLLCLTPQRILALTIYSGLCLATLASALGHLGSADPLVMGCFAALAGVGLLFSLLRPATQSGLPTAALWLTLMPFLGMALATIAQIPTQRLAFERPR